MKLHAEDDISSWAAELLVVALKLEGKQQSQSGARGQEPPRITPNTAREMSTTPKRVSEVTGEGDWRELEVSLDLQGPKCPPGRFPHMRQDGRKKLRCAVKQAWQRLDHGSPWCPLEARRQ